MVKVMPSTNGEVPTRPGKEQSDARVPTQEPANPEIVKETASSRALSVKEVSGSNRKRIVSLDRGQDAMPDDDNSTVTSDGESSYFAKHLPDPKSRNFVSDTGSISSAPERTAIYHTARESDASLSFSDDDDDGGMEEYMGSPLLSHSVTIPPRDEVHFRGITHMHSANSLKSSGEFDQLEAELQNVGTAVRTSPHERPHNNPGYSFYVQPQSSPPTILSRHEQGLQHPQAVSARQMQAWMAAGNAAAASLRDGVTYGSMNDALGTSVDESKGSHASLPLVYSEDEDTAEAVAAGSSPPRGNGSGRGEFRPRRGGPGVPSGGGGGADSAPGQTSKNRGGVTGTTSDDIDASDSSVEDVNRYADGTYKVYWQRWLMLMYMSILNLLSDWTCYSVAPIATLTAEAFGSIDPEQLVVIFLVANAVATVCEPIMLARIGLRRTVLVGAFLLMVGSTIKSGGLPPFIQSNLEKGHGEWRVVLGFFLVGLSQPLYQCTPALLSASWFPEHERTMATGVALNANQLGIGFAFIFGTLLVKDSNDIVPYFRLLSMVSTVAFLGSLIQFRDAPPTKPSETAKVMRGDLQWELPKGNEIWESVRNLGTPKITRKASKESRAQTDDDKKNQAAARRRLKPRPSSDDSPFKVASAPSSAPNEASVALQRYDPSPMMPGPVRPGQNGHEEPDGDFNDVEYTEGPDGQGMPFYPGPPGYGVYPNVPPGPPFPPQHMPPYPQHAYYGPPYHPQYQQGPPMYAPPQQNPRQHPQQNSQQHPQQHPPGFGYYQPNPYYYAHPQFPPQQYHYYPYDQQNISLAPASYIEEYAEPTLTVNDNLLNINIRDDQVLLSFKACFARPGFIHSLATFAVSGIVINTLSTYMDYLVRLNGAGREYVGIVGGTFQFIIMLSSLVVGKQTDKTRAYYSVTIAMLVLGAFALAECGVSLDADRGGDLRWSLIVVALLVGPLQPVSTELGVEVAYPLSENTVLVIQQLFSNLLSALFIPFFKELRDVGTEQMNSTELYERPQYTFSFYLLIVLHASATVFFATFNGRYLRYEHELLRKENEKEVKERKAEEAYQKQYGDQHQWGGHYEAEELYPNERQPLVSNQVI